MTNTDSIMREFIKEYLYKKSLNTLQDYEIRIRRFLKYINKDIRKITCKDINYWKEHGIETNKSIAKDANAVKMFLIFCIEKGFLSVTCSKAKIFESKKDK